MLFPSTLSRGLHIAAALALLLTATTQDSLALQIPPLRGRVNDNAGMLSPGVVRQLELMLKDFEQKDSTQIVVLAVASLEGAALEEFSMRVAERWKIGQKGLDNGAILLISRADRKVRIEVGYGLEGRLTDLKAGRIIREVIVPEFRAGRFDRGVVNGVQAMIDTVRGEFQAAEKKEPHALDARHLTDAIPFLILFVFLVSALGRVSRPLGTAAGGFLMPFLGHMAFSPGLGMLAALAGVGLIAGFIIAVFAGLVSAGGPGAYRPWPRGGSDGFPGGGFPSGGGGFSTGGGGFSGGGGSFGGGGSSGSW
jgi:uncharacterized protein